MTTLVILIIRDNIEYSSFSHAYLREFVYMYFHSQSLLWFLGCSCCLSLTTKFKKSSNLNYIHN